MNFDLRSVPWRTGRKVGRTIYAMVAEQPTDNDILIGMMDDCELAREVVEAHNEYVARRFPQGRMDF